MIYLLNAFSLNMLAEPNATISVRQISEQEAAEIVSSTYISAVGHADTAAVFSQMLGVDVQPNRVNIVLKPNDIAVVGQYIGPRLPEGATKLPEGATIRWFLVQIFNV